MAIRAFVSDTVAKGALAPNTGNQGYTGTSAIQEWLHRLAIENFEPNHAFLMVPQVAQKPNGYGRVSYFRSVQQGRRGTDAAAGIRGTSNFTNLASGGFETLTNNNSTTEPAMRGLQIGTVTFAPQLYATRYQFGRFMSMLTPIDITKRVIHEMMRSYYAEKDLLIQESYYADATTNSNVQYPSGITALSDFAAANLTAANNSGKFSIATMLAARRLMRQRNAPVFPALGNYLMIISPSVEYDLTLGDGKTDTNNSFLEINKNTTMLAQRLVQGVVGTFLGFTVVVSTNMKTYSHTVSSNTVSVHPTYVFGAESAVIWPMNMRLNIVTEPDRTSVNALTTQVGMTWFWGFRILQKDSYTVFLNAVTT